nr:MAG TPA: hypothetical protein [Caudoviricetes sp.]
MAMQSPFKGFQNGLSATRFGRFFAVLCRVKINDFARALLSCRRQHGKN